MHDGCTAAFENGKQIVDKIRMMGFNTSPSGTPLMIDCNNCNSQFEMTTMESVCPKCQMVYGVTPCHSHSAAAVKAAGINY